MAFRGPYNWSDNTLLKYILILCLDYSAGHHKSSGASDTGHHKKWPGECKWNWEKIYTTASANIAQLKLLKIMIVTRPKCLQCHAKHSHQPANRWEASPNSLQAAPGLSADNNNLNSFTQQGSPMSPLACTPSRFQRHTNLQTSLTYKPTIYKPTVL